MKINVSELLKEPGRELEINELFSPDYSMDGIEINGSIGLNIRLLSTGDSILVKGIITADVKLICGRCLNNFLKNLKIDIDEQFKKTYKINRHRKTEEEKAEDEGLFFPISGDNQIDLDEMVRQNILIAIPIKPLCSMDCRI